MRTVRPGNIAIGQRLLLLLCTLALLGAVGCGKNDIPIVGSGGEYKSRLAKAEKLSAPILEKYERGESLTKEDTSKLEEALLEFKGFIAFQPDFFGPHFGAAKIHDALGRPEEAFAHMRQFIELGPPKPTEDVKRLLAEAHYYVGKTYEDQGEFEVAKLNAQRAVEYFKDSPHYLGLLASCLLREGREAEAHALVDRALAIDPSHSRSRQLHRLMKPH